MNLFSKKPSNINSNSPVRAVKNTANLNASSNNGNFLPKRRYVSSDKDFNLKRWSLISGCDDKSEFSISKGMCKNIAVIRILDVEDGPKSCIIVSRSESYGDTAFLEIAERVEGNGYSIKETCISDSGFLLKIYEGQSTGSETGFEDDANAQELIRALDRELIQVAIENGASDIHIELRDTDVKIFMREDGDLQAPLNWGVEQTQRLMRVLFMLADERTKEVNLSEDVGQSMSIKRIINGLNIKLRVQTEIAYPHGKDIVMRVLLEGVDAKVMSLEELGYSDGHLLMIDKMLSKPDGAIIICGVTGSGKSTTLQTLMSNISKANPGKKLISIEDPPEYILKNVTQIPVRTGGKYSEGGKSPFAETMRHAMRMDPDVLMPGELRDKMSVELFTGMVQSGHKVLTTIHAGSVFGIIERLAKLGLDVSEVSGRNFISGLIFQTLIPKLCPNCKIPYNPMDWSDYQGSGADVFANQNLDSDEQNNERGFRGQLGAISGVHERIKEVWRTGSTIFVRGGGCDSCKGGGKGRTVCAEMVLLTPRMRRFLNQGDIESAYQTWKNLKKIGTDNNDNDQVATIHTMAGMTALDHALIKMRGGILSPVDVELALGFLTGDDDDDDQIMMDHEK